jgi:alpha-tubulin suppressor-like RCC1 family protein
MTCVDACDVSNGGCASDEICYHAWPSNDVECEANSPVDAGGIDSGPAGSPDSGLHGPPDAGPPDAGPPDAGPPDAGPPDAGPPDAGPPDAGPPDAGPPDAGGPFDAGPSDAGSPDAGNPCAAASCGNGTCAVVSGNAVCSCPTGEVFDGTTCVANGCLGTTCPANATCSVQASGPVCQCDPGYVDSGGNCEFVGKVSAGPGATCAIYPDHTLWCWGGNEDGNPGGAMASPYLPAQIGTGTYMDVSMGGFSGWAFCAIGTDQSLWCSDQSGYVAPANMQGMAVYQQVGMGMNWASVSVGDYFACALAPDGTGYCWGDDSAGELGDGGANPQEFSATPQIIPGGMRWLSISAGVGFACGIQTDNSLWCWGDLGFGGFGGILPTRVLAGQTFSSVSAGESWCAVRTDGQIWCNGTLGISQPTPVTSGQTWVSVSAGVATILMTGQTGFCAIRSDRTLWCEGDNTIGELGIGTETDPVSSLVQVGSSSSWTAVSALYTQTCAVDTSGQIWCWGDNELGQVGDGLPGSNTEAAPIQVLHDTDWAQMGVGDAYHECALKQDGTAWCWGRNAHAEVGDTTFIDQSVPSQEATHRTWSSIVESWTSTAGIDQGQSALWLWGDQGLGNGYLTIPTVLSEPVWKAACDGEDEGCAISSDGTLDCWGWGGFGGPLTSESDFPIVISQDTDWASVSCGYLYSCALKKDGTAWCWGKVGTSLSYTPSNSNQPPYQINGDTDWTVLSPGPSQACGVKQDHTLWCWTISAPIQADSSTDWATFSQGHYGACGIKVDGSLWCAHSFPFTFARFDSNVGWTSVNVGYDEACGTKADGTLWCWGYNNYGQLGNGAPWTPIPTNIPHP